MSDPPRHHRRPASPEELELAAAAPPVLAVGPAVSEYLRQKGFMAVVRLGEIVEVWDLAVGPQVAAHCQPTRLQGDALIVEVDNSAWLTELAFQEERILEGLRDRLGQSVAKHVKGHVRRSFGVE
jgi:predicted nucleic acid-binding Zn ribbon protein